jgi:hypothetical protein
MRFNERKRLDTSQIDDKRGVDQGGGGGLGGLPGMSGGKMGLPMGKAGGGIGVLVMLGILLFTQCQGGGGGGGGFGLPSAGEPASNAAAPREGAMADQELEQKCRTGADANEFQDCRTVAVVNDVNAFWADEFSRRDRQYRSAQTQLFTEGTQTGCGPASSAVGPFYCPRDQKAYIDLGFFEELRTKFGAKGGDFAESYVIAHEYGHHVQNLLGISEEVQRSGDMQGPESNAVRLELQADCFAGVWAANATRGPDPLIVEISEEDIREGLDAAARVGDDFIQKRFQGNVTPESWTHGSSEQRQRWFLTGFRSGEMTDCDTFNTNRL